MIAVAALGTTRCAPCWSDPTTMHVRPIKTRGVKGANRRRVVAGGDTMDARTAAMALSTGGACRTATKRRREPSVAWLQA
jgi:hypothetical protein